MSRSGIFAAGNWIIDHTKQIDAWPAQDTLVNILDQTSANGGSPFNLLVDLAKLGAPFSLSGGGLIGTDADGDTVLRVCKEHGIDTSQMHRSEQVATSYTDVMSVVGTGRRTFFHQRGANALFGPEHIELASITAKIFHLGYLLLLDRFDKPSDRSGTIAADTLRAASDVGLLTSIDVVSAECERFAEVVLPTLQHVDFCIMNELEAGRTTGCAIRHPDGSLDDAAIDHAGKALVQAGTRRWVVIHFPEGAAAFSPSGESIRSESLQLRPDQIVGTVGAGDAFAAGLLYGLHEHCPIEECLNLAARAAADCLSHQTTSGGIKPIYMQSHVAAGQRR